MTNPKAGQPEFQPDAEMFVCMDPTGCYHVSWNAEQHKAKMAQVGAAHGARYVRAGQPYMVEQRARIEELAEKLVQPSGDDFTDLRVRDAAAEEILSLQSQLEAAESNRDAMAAQVQRLIGRGNGMVGYMMSLEAVEAGAVEAYAKWLQEVDAGLSLTSKALQPQEVKPCT